jgi:hypothetical protein
MINFPDEDQPHGWSSNVCTVYGKVWPAFILSLPWQISLDIKYKVIRDVNTYDDVLSPKHFFKAKTNNDRAFFCDYRKNRKRISIVSSTPLFIYDVISFIPSFMFWWLRPILRWYLARKRERYRFRLKEQI